jgi:hypothetical protein
LCEVDGDGAAASATLRSLGANSVQAAAGNHTHSTYCPIAGPGGDFVVGGNLQVGIPIGYKDLYVYGDGVFLEGFGCNGKSAQAAYAKGTIPPWYGSYQPDAGKYVIYWANGTDPHDFFDLVIAIKNALVANGILV